jgi:pimeloyl-ACP methyl ester carboxylesterase
MRKDVSDNRPGRTALRAAGVGLPLAALAGIGYSALFVPHHMELPPALPGDRREFTGRAGRLSYYAAGTAGPPLLLIHSVNAAASAYEVRPPFERYSLSRRVYALDLPGFGFSERSSRDYTPRLYADAILDMLDEIQRDCGAEAVDTLALSLGCEFLARAASEHPQRFASLALVSPTSMGKDDRFYGEPGSVRGVAAARSFWEFPPWSQALFDLLNSRASQRYFLAKTFGSSDAIDQGLLEYDYPTAHQPGARHAPFAFISGLLFSADITRVYEALEPPVWVAHGVRGDFTNYGGVARLAARPNWEVSVFQTGGIPYFERPDEFAAAYDTFLEKTARSIRARPKM